MARFRAIVNTQRRTAISSCAVTEPAKVPRHLEEDLDGDVLGIRHASGSEIADHALGECEVDLLRGHRSDLALGGEAAAAVVALEGQAHELVDELGRRGGRWPPTASGTSRSG